MLWLKLFTRFKGTFVGKDVYGNRYYRAQGQHGEAERRWVMYKGIPEASKVPAEWHGWLHHLSVFSPSEKAPKREAWEKKHLPNLSGTAYAYHPLKSVEATKRSHRSYEAWRPCEEKSENESS